jgi:Acetyltransferase (GNAT) domain
VTMSACARPLDTRSATAERALRRVDRDEWIGVAGRFRDHNYRHCWDYAAMLAGRGQATAEHVVAADGRLSIGAASVRVKRLPGVGTGIAYISGGPLVRRTDGDADARARLELVLRALREEYVDRRGFVLRAAPAIGDPQWNLVQDECFSAAGFGPARAVPPYRTMVVDIARPLGELRAGLAKKWRNLLGNAERRDLRVAHGRDPGLFEEFRPLFDELVARKSLAVDLGGDFYAALQRRLPARERLHVAIAYVEEQPAAGVVASMHGDTAVYLLGASNELGRRTNAAYLLQWQVIAAATRAGCRRYDLGGIDPEGNPGVHQFKKRMGGAEISAAGPYELAPGRLRGAAVRAAERARRAATGRPPRRRARPSRGA